MLQKWAQGAFTEVLKLSKNEASDAVGVRVEVSGSTVVCFPGVFSGVVLTPTANLGGFEGVFGLGHHIQSVGEGVFFTVSTKSNAELFRRVDGEGNAMDEETAPLPAGLMTLRTSVAGRHLKGQVGEATVVHGHEPSGEKGAVGLVLDGRGEVRIIQVSVETSQERDEEAMASVRVYSQGPRPQ